MDVAALAQTLITGRTQAAYQDAQVGLLKKSLDAQTSAASQLIDSMSLPLATEGAKGTHVNTYA